MGPLNAEALSLYHAVTLGTSQLLAPSARVLKKIQGTLSIYTVGDFYNRKQIFEKFLTMNSIKV